MYQAPPAQPSSWNRRQRVQWVISPIPGLFLGLAVAVSAVLAVGRVFYDRNPMPSLAITLILWGVTGLVYGLVQSVFLLDWGRAMAFWVPFCGAAWTLTFGLVPFDRMRLRGRLLLQALELIILLVVMGLGQWRIFAPRLHACGGLIAGNLAVLALLNALVMIGSVLYQSNI